MEIGRWRQHLPWQRAVSVTQSSSKVYFATEWAVVEIDKADRSPRFLTKVEGLSDVGMNLIRFNQETNVLLLCYANSNLDLWNAADGSVVNLPFIQKNVNISGDKKIYDVVFEGKNAYLACGFGILKLDLEAAEVEYTVFTDLPIRSLAIFQNYLYAGTEEGLYRLPANDVNPADFSRWSLLGNPEGMPQGHTVAALQSFDNKLFIGLEHAFCQYNGQTLDTLDTHPQYDLSFLSTEGNGLVVGWRIQDFGGRVQYLEPGSTVPYDIHWVCESLVPNYTVEEDSKKFWMADANDDFRFYDDNLGKCDRFRFNSPHTHQVAELAINNNKVFVATIGSDVNLGPVYNREGLYIFNSENDWNRFSGTTNPELIDGDCDKDF